MGNDGAETFCHLQSCAPECGVCAGGGEDGEWSFPTFFIWVYFHIFGTIGYRLFSLSIFSLNTITWASSQVASS